MPARESFYDIKERGTWAIRLIIAGLATYWLAGCSALLCAISAAIPVLRGEAAVLWPPAAMVALATALALAIAAAHYLWATRSVIRRTLDLFSAQAIDPRDPYHTLFRNTVEEIRIAAGYRGEIRCVVVPCASLNGFSLRDPRGAAVVGLTEGLLARLKRAEIQAVVAQLAGQIIAGDALVSTVAFSLFGSLLETVEQALDLVDDGTPHARERESLIAPAFAGLVVLRLFLKAGVFLTMALTRERVYRSDALAVELTRDPMSVAMALRRLCGSWRGSGTFGDATEAILFVSPGRGRHDLAIGFLGHLFRAQPPLQARLDRALAMAGTSLRRVDEELSDPAAPRAAPIDIVEQGPLPLWRVHHDGAWREPLPLESIALLPGFSPASYVCRAGTTSIVAAGSDPIVARRLFPATAKAGQCPRCRVDLADIHYEGVGIQACPACQGRLVPGDAIQRILSRTIVDISPEMREKARAWKAHVWKRPSINRSKDNPNRLPCPRCRQPMVVTFYSPEYFIEVDRCHVCRLTWYDREELELLQALVEDAAQQILAAD